MGDTTYVVKVFYDHSPSKPRWVMVGPGRGLGIRGECDSVSITGAAADAEAAIWISTDLSAAFNVVVEPA